VIYALPKLCILLRGEPQINTTPTRLNRMCRAALKSRILGRWVTSLHLNRIFRTFGAGLSCVRSIPRQHSRFQKLETCPPIHLSLDRF
jgi:hypothetical protein